jgi:hypothetical protein
VSTTNLAPHVAPASRFEAYDGVMRRLLFLPEGASSTDRRAQRLFSTSMLVSAVRCLLTYIVLPVLSPVIGASTGVGPAIGIPLAVVALVFDVLGIRRFFAANHRLRWPITGVYLAVICLVLALLGENIATLVH